MYQKLIILLLMLFISCKKQESSSTASAPTTPAINNTVSVDFEQFLSQYKVYSTNHGLTNDYNGLTISYDATLSGTNILGTCARSTKTVKINQTYWQAWANALRLDDMEQLLFHELAHCIQNRTHDDSTLVTSDDGTTIAKSLMNSYHVSTVTYKVNYNYYIEELFNSSYSAQVYTSGISQFPSNLYASLINESLSNDQDIQVSYITTNAPLLPTIEHFKCNDNF